MSQSQTIRDSRSKFNVSCQLYDMDDSTNHPAQENTAELNQLSTTTEALNQEDSTELSNSKVVFVHQQSSKKYTPKRTEHGNGDVAHEKQSAVCCTDIYIETLRTSQIAQSKFQNNMVGLNPPDIQQIMRLKPNYLKFSTARAVHIVDPFAFVVAIPLACHSVAYIHFTHNCSLCKNYLSLFNTFNSLNLTQLPSLASIISNESYDKYTKIQAYIVQMEHHFQAYITHLKRFGQTNNNYCKTKRSTDKQEMLLKEYSSGILQNHFIATHNQLQQQPFSYRITSVTHLITHKIMNQVNNHNISEQLPINLSRSEQQNILMNSRQELLMAFAQDLIEDNDNLTFDQSENDKQKISPIILNQIKQDINSKFTSQILESFQINQSIWNANHYNKNIIPIYNHDSYYKEKNELFEQYSFKNCITNKIKMNSALEYQQQPILIYSNCGELMEQKNPLWNNKQYQYLFFIKEYYYYFIYWEKKVTF